MTMSDLATSGAEGPHRFAACFTADVEQDCPPYLQTCRGMREGMPQFLDLLGRRGVRGTFFTTGEMARRFPDVITRVVSEGHELACHGDTHRDFTRLTRAEADAELRASLATLRAFAPVVSFRAPYLRFPREYVPLLAEHGLQIDSSVARYKFGAHHRRETARGPQSADAPSDAILRIPASATSSVLRLPRWLRLPWLLALERPLVIFIHPWEAVDFRRSRLRWDCRFRTGEPALRLWGETIGALQRRGARFLPLNELALATA